MACGRSGAAVTSVIMLLKASNKEARLTMDKVNHDFIFNIPCSTMHGMITLSWPVVTGFSASWNTLKVSSDSEN